MKKASQETPDREAQLERLAAVKREIEGRLARLERHLYLSPEERVEVTKLKKLKLAMKDQIVSLQHRQN